MVFVGTKARFMSEQANERVKRILELTRKEDIRWQLKEFDRRIWSIEFNAEHESKTLILKKSSEAPGRWYISENASLEAKTQDGNTLWSSAYYHKYDHVETLDKGGDFPVSALASLVIEKFRKSLDLHWSIM